MVPRKGMTMTVRGSFQQAARNDRFWPNSDLSLIGASRPKAEVASRRKPNGHGDPEIFELATAADWFLGFRGPCYAPTALAPRGSPCRVVVTEGKGTPATARAS